jgi:outer membrane murein-binding lipoprotein Lpp
MRSVFHREPKASRGTPPCGNRFATLSLRLRRRPGAKVCKSRAELVMPGKFDAAEMPRLHAFDEEFEEDVDAVVGGRRRKIVQRLLMLAVVVIGAGAIAALVLAWSAADGRLRLELQSTAPSPRTVAREAMEEKVDRLHRQVEALESEIRELTQARQQAADAISALQAAVQEARDYLPPPVYWYSNPAALNVTVAGQPHPGARRPTPAWPEVVGRTPRLR